MTPFLIREARRQDVAAVTVLWKSMMDFHGAHDPRFRFTPDAERAFERHLLNSLRTRGAHVLIAHREERVIGYILGEIHARSPIYPVGTYGFISDISVQEDWRRRGVGRALVQAMMQWFQRNRVTAVELFVAEANPTSTAFWQAMGFRDYLRLLRAEIE